MRFVLACLLAVAAVGAGEVRAASLADRCPAYAAELQRARLRLARDDRAGALRALRAARTALDACVGSDGQPVMHAVAARASGGA